MFKNLDELKSTKKMNRCFKRKAVNPFESIQGTLRTSINVHSNQFRIGACASLILMLYESCVSMHLKRVFKIHCNKYQNQSIFLFFLLKCSLFESLNSEITDKYLMTFCLKYCQLFMHFSLLFIGDSLNKWPKVWTYDLKTFSE